MSAAPASILAAEIFAPGQIGPLLTRLSRGEAVSFSHEQGGPLAFIIEKCGRSFVVRDDRGRTLASGSTFAEAWRKRPRVADEPSRDSSTMDLERVGRCLAVLAQIKAHPATEGSLTCLACGGRIAWAKEGPRQHARFACETVDCLRGLE